MIASSLFLSKRPVLHTQAFSFIAPGMARNLKSERPLWAVVLGTFSQDKGVVARRGQKETKPGLDEQKRMQDRRGRVSWLQTGMPNSPPDARVGKSSEPGEKCRALPCQASLSAGTIPAIGFKNRWLRCCQGTSLLGGISGCIEKQEASQCNITCHGMQYSKVY